MLKNGDEKSAYWCVVSGSDLWSVDEGIPFGTAQALNLPVSNAVEIGEYQQHPVYWLNASDLEFDVELTPLRSLLTINTELFHLISKAVQYGHMTQTQRFCPHCGGRTYFNHSQNAMQCQDCRTLHYPRISTCIIVAVRKDDQILLAQHPRHKTGMYTVIAGFVEVGETLEECVAREVREETGLEIKNIRYMASQPWAFPSNLMAGFLAEYAGGDVKPDYTELSDADWFSPAELPELAPKGTIARELIEQTLKDINKDHL